MNAEEMQQEADALRGQAVILLQSMLKTPDNYDMAIVSRLIDTIIGAAVIQIAVAHTIANRTPTWSDHD